MSKILDLAKSFEQASSEQAKHTEQTVTTEFKKHEQRLKDMLQENERAMNSAIQEQNKRLLPVMLKTWSIVAIAVITALLLMWGILAYQSHKIGKNADLIAQQQSTIQQLENAGGNLNIQNCLDDKNRKRMCIQMNTKAGNWKGGYLVPMGIIDDRTRKALTSSLRTSTATTAEGSRFTQDVRNYTTRESGNQSRISGLIIESHGNRAKQKRKLEQISAFSQQLEQSIAGLQDTKRSFDQAIASVRAASQQVEKMNESERSYSSSFGLNR